MFFVPLVFLALNLLSFGIISPHSNLNEFIVFFRYVAVLLSALMLCALVFKPISNSSKLKKERIYSNGTESGICQQNGRNVKSNLISNKRYIIWVLAIPIALCGYFVPYVHLVSISIYYSSRFTDTIRGPIVERCYPC